MDQPKNTQCLVCMDREATHGFLCAAGVHKCVCEECTTDLKECPYCRHPRTLIVRVFDVGCVPDPPAPDPPAPASAPAPAPDPPAPAPAPAPDQALVVDNQGRLSGLRIENMYLGVEPCGPSAFLVRLSEPGTPMHMRNPVEAYIHRNWETPGFLRGETQRITFVRTEDKLHMKIPVDLYERVAEVLKSVLD